MKSGSPSMTFSRRELPRRFDISSDDDDKQLKEWCRLHWQLTISKGINGCNAPTYHDCCLTFTKRGCIKKDSHPVIQSASVLKIPSLKHSNSHEELYRWLKRRLKVHHQLGKTTYFPSINSPHFNEEDDSSEGAYEQLEFLGKRYNTAVTELDQLRQENENLKEENQRLAKASASWCKKYQELYFQNQDDTPSYAETTPFKSNKEIQTEFMEL